MPTVDAICAECQKAFTTYRSPAYLAKTRHLFCSRACYFSWQATAEMFICDECGREFLARRTPDRPNPRFCARKCHTKHVNSIVDYVCHECGKVFRRHQSHQYKYCSKECTGKHSYIVQRNRKHEPRDCKNCGAAINGPGRLQRRRFCDAACRTAYAEGVSRADYLAALSAETDEMKTFFGYRGPNWKQQRRNARHRDGYRCQRCGMHEREMSQQLSVHHIKPFREFAIEDYRSANALANLVSLCTHCHKRVEMIGWRVEQRKFL